MYSKKRGFTLIELLVVVSIIALLVSILLPSLSKAKRMAKVVVGANNLHQLAIGLTMSANDNDGKYLPRKGGTPTCIARYSWYTADELDDYNAVLDSMYSVVGGEAAEMFWCPFEKNYGPGTGYEGIGTGDREKWEPLFYTGNDGSYYIGYSIYAGWEWSNSAILDWNESGNASTEQPPKISGKATDVIAADNNYAFYNGGYDRWQAMHSLPQRGTWTQVGDEYYPIPPGFQESNAAYGDGHVETHRYRDELKWVRVTTTDYRYFY